MDNKLELTIIIPYYKGYKHIYKCVNSIYIPSNIKSRSKILIIDNDWDSNGLALDFFTTNIDIVEIVKTKPNLGFGRAINYGLRLIANKYKYVIFLNQDCLLNSNLIAGLVEHLNATGINTMYTPLIKEYDSDEIHSSLTNEVNNVYTNLEGKNNISIDYVPAVCIAAHVSLMDNIGGFDPAFFHYGEDNDFFLRNKDNVDLFLVPYLQIKHVGSLKNNLNIETRINFLLGKLRYKLRYESGDRYWRTLYFQMKLVYENSNSVSRTMEFVYSGILLKWDKSLKIFDRESVKKRIDKSLSNI